MGVLGGKIMKTPTPLDIYQTFTGSLRLVVNIYTAGGC